MLGALVRTVKSVLLTETGFSGTVLRETMMVNPAFESGNIRTVIMRLNMEQVFRVDLFPAVEHVQIMQDFCLNGQRDFCGTGGRISVMREQHVLEQHGAFRICPDIFCRLCDQQSPKDRVPHEIAMLAVARDQAGEGRGFKFDNLSDVVEQNAGNQRSRLTVPLLLAATVSATTAMSTVCISRPCRKAWCTLFPAGITQK